MKINGYNMEAYSNLSSITCFICDRKCCESMIFSKPCQDDCMYTTDPDHALNFQKPEDKDHPYLEKSLDQNLESAYAEIKDLQDEYMHLIDRLRELRKKSEEIGK